MVGHGPFARLRVQPIEMLLLLCIRAVAAPPPPPKKQLSYEMPSRMPSWYASGSHKGLERFWDHAPHQYAHIAYTGYKLKNLTDQWRQRWIRHGPPDVFRGATVAEYGIGAGLLGEMLLTEYKAAHYIGMDISTRQLEAAQTHLSACATCKWRHTLLHVGENAADNLEPFRIDVFVSQAVIQHFPSDAYLAGFLRVLSRSNIPHLVLQTRAGDKTTQGETITRAQLTDTPFLEKYLPNYRLLWRTDPREPPPRSDRSGYVYHWFALQKGAHVILEP